MSFTITKINYPKTLMLGESYDFSKITVETDTAITIDHIDATWLDIQPPFSEMGYYPLQITATASNGETASESVQVFAFKKPHDGLDKCMVLRYKNETRLISYNCSDNVEHNKLYYHNNLAIKDITSYNGYVGQQSYLFDEETKSWTCEKDNHGYTDYVLRCQTYCDELLYSNSVVYAKDQTTILHEADEIKHSTTWNTEVENRYISEYTSITEFDDTIEAYMIVYGSYSGLNNTYAFCFKNLSEEGPLSLKFKAKSHSKPVFYHNDSNALYALMRFENGKWSVFRAWNRVNSISMLNYVTDANLGKITFVNGLQESFNIDLEVCDFNGEYARPILYATPPQEEVTKDARYRVKDEDGSYSILHLETNREMVIGLNEKLSEISALLENQYNKPQTMALFNEVDEEIQAMEQVAEGLNQRLEVTESSINDLQTALEQQVSHAQTAEAHLQEQLNGIDFDLDVVNHPESGILAQSKDYTDELVKGLADGAIKDLEGELAGNVADLTNRFEALNQTVASNKAEAEVKLSQLDGHLTNTESRVEVLEGQMVELSEEDARLAVEIERLNTHLSSKGSDTLVFETREEFEQASLSPKVGDLVYILEEKRAYIFTQENGFVVFDEITNHLDLVSYIKKGEATALFEGVESHLTAEVERAQLAEQQLSHQLADLSDVVGTHSAAISGLETLTQAQGVEIDDLESSRYTQDDIDRLIEEAIELQAPHVGEEAPVLEGLKEGHVWLDTTIE